MPHTNTSNNDSSPSDGSSSSKGDSDQTKKPDKDPPEKDPKTTPPKSHEKSPPPQQSPPPPPSPSPPPSKQKPKPSPPPPPWHNDNSSSPAHIHPQKQLPPLRPQFGDPPPHKSPSSPPSRHANSNDSPLPFSPASKSDHDGGGSSPAKSRGSSSPSLSLPADNAAKYFGYTLAGVFFLALVFVVFLMFIRRKRVKGHVHPASFTPSAYHKVLVKTGSEAHYYVQQPQFSKEKSYENGINIGGNMKNLGDRLDSPQLNAQMVFRYDTIMEITDSFSREKVIGEGGFGCVYKAELPDGKPVAVKRLKSGSLQGDREFRAEVEIISRVHHRHLVSLVGYCLSDQERVLIYEFVPNGTLYHHLHGSGIPVLDWDKRLKIAIGAAKGLAYLHEDCSQKIIHRDIKSANILLDYAFEAQVADFGLAKLHDATLTHVSTRVIGTFGYMAPEYATSGKLTDRSDVFSFGVVLLELLTGRKPVDDSQPLGDESVVEWARPLLLRAMESHDFSELIDPRLEKKFVESEVFRMVESAVACIRHSAPKRPRMVQVVRTLDSGDDISDLSNGVKYGNSTQYDSGQYDKEIMLFRRTGNGSLDYSDVDMCSRESSFSREISGFQHSSVPGNSRFESDCRPFNSHRGSSTG